MKTESDFTQEFIGFVKDTLSIEHLVLKHSDRFTKGVPDLSVSSPRNRSIWIEAKRLDRPRDNIRAPVTWIKKEEEIQMYTVVRLGGFYLAYDPSHSTWAFLSGRTVALHYRGKSVIHDAYLHPDEHIFVGDRYDLFQKVVTYLKKEL